MTIQLSRILRHLNPGWPFLPAAGVYLALKFVGVRYLGWPAGHWFWWVAVVALGVTAGLLAPKNERKECECS